MIGDAPEQFGPRMGIGDGAVNQVKQRSGVV